MADAATAAAERHRMRVVLKGTSAPLGCVGFCSCVCELEGCHVCSVPVWGTDFKSPQTVNKILNKSTEISLNISKNLSVEIE